MSTVASSSTASSSTSAAFWSTPVGSLERIQQTNELKLIRRALPRFPSPPLRVSRVGQLDASLLDHELESILIGPVSKSLEQLRSPGSSSFEPEMMALLRIAVLKMSIYERGATYGSGLQNLKYRNEWMHQKKGLQSTAHDSRLTPFQKIAYIALSVLPSYLLARVRDRMLASSWSEEPLPRQWYSLIDPRRLLPSKSRRRNTDESGRLGREWRRVVWEGLRVGEKVLALLDLTNFLIFLFDGRYRTVIDRMLGMRLIYAQRSVSRNVSFEFLNRQLVWEAFTEFLLFLMPLINLHRLRSKVTRFLTTTAPSSKPIALVLSLLPAPLLKVLRLPPRLSSAPSTSAEVNEKKTGTLSFLSATTCPICYSASAIASIPLPAPSTVPVQDQEDPLDPAAATAALAALVDSMTASATSPASSTSREIQVKIPYVTNCTNQCRYCYYCVVQALANCEEEGEDAWTCLRCGEGVTALEREVVVLPEETEEEEEEEESENDSDGQATEDTRRD